MNKIINVERAENGKYILRYDASLHKESDCFRYVFNILIRGLHDASKDFKMEYGTAFHKALQLYYDKRPLTECIAAAVAHYSQPEIYIPEGEWRCTAHLINCLMQYDAWYKREGDLIRPLVGPLFNADGTLRLDAEGKPMVGPCLEQKFALPYYQTPRTEVLLTGTIDMRATYLPTGNRIIVDHKTTSLNNPDGYLAEYDLSPQLLLYKLVDDRLFQQDVGCMINGIFLNRSNKNVFRRSDMLLFNARRMMIFEGQLSSAVQRLVRAFEEYLDSGDDHATFRHNYNCCSKKYGMCKFKPLCLQDDDDSEHSIIENTFSGRVYNPLNFQT